MKTLTKIKLINWHIFQNETISLKGNTLIFGENGSGKSTLIDAIHYVIDGGKDVKFNSAANTSNQNKRTIESYMRLKTGVEGKEYLRNGDVVTHIALEFFDTVSKENSVIGVCLELIKGNKNANEKFYQLVKSKIDDKFYLQNNENGTFKVNTFAEFSKFIQNNDIRINVFDGSKRENCSKIHRCLGLFNENSLNYSILLNKAISFRPIDNVHKFVYSYLMPEKDIDLDSLRSSIRSYREIKELVIKEETKKKLLDEVLTCGDELEACEDKKISYELVMNERKVSFLGNKLKDNNNKIEILHTEIEQIESKKDFAENDKESLEKSKYAYENNTTNLQYQRLLSQKSNLKKELENLKNKIDKFNAKIDFELRIIKYFNIDIKLEKYKNSEDLQGFIRDINNYRQILKEDLEEHIKENKSETKRALNELVIRKDELLKDKKNLENYHTDFKKDIGIDLNGFIDLIKREFNKKFNKDLEIGPLCNYIEIKESFEVKRNLLEQFLANRRFDIIVNGRYFDFVSKIYNANKDKYESLSLIDLNKYQDEIEVSQDSLFNYFNYNSVDAEKYARAILGNAFEKSSFDNFVFKEEEITSDGFIYLKNKLIQRAKRIIKLPYIGFNSYKKRLAKCIDDIEKLNQEIEEKKKVYEELNSKLDLILQSKVDDLCAEGVFVYPEFIQTQISLQELEDQINTLINENEDLTELNLKIEEFANKIKEKANLIKELDKELIGKGSKLSTLEQSVQKDKDEFEEAYKVLAEISNHPRISLIKDKNYKVSSCLTSDELKKELKNIDYELSNLSLKLIDRMNNYNHEFGEIFPAKKESFKDYKELYNKTIKNNLSKYKSELENAEEKAMRGFKEDYISKIRRYINEEREHINKLNNILKSKPFGTDGDVYEFIMEKNQKVELGRFYDIFMSSSDFEPRDLFSEKLDKKDEDALMELFNVLTDESNQSSEKERKLDVYTDYRSFMSYDIKIKYSNNEVAYFSKVCNEKSGGETQTPFYIIIAASFEQLFTASSQFNKRESPFGLVILDEAFNNMDEQRIEAMISYFKTLNEQFLVVVPSQRASIMMDYFDTTITLLKKKNRAILIEDLRENE